jgi:hypothetical protein
MVAVAQPTNAPLRTPDDLAVDRNRYPAPPLGRASGRDNLGHRALVANLAGLAVHVYVHRSVSTRANRAGDAGAIASGAPPEMSISAIASAVTGVIRIPFR